MLLLLLLSLLWIWTTVLKALLGAGMRQVLPYQYTGVEAPLTSVTPVVQVRQDLVILCDMGNVTDAGVIENLVMCDVCGATGAGVSWVMVM